MRSKALIDMIFDKEDGKNIEHGDFDRLVSENVDFVVAKQKEVGISIPSDGEMSKLSYATYVKDRLSGFEGDSDRRTPSDLKDFPSFCEKIAKIGGTPTYTRPVCVGKIEIKSFEPLFDDIRRFKTALNKHGYDQGFLNAVSPGTIALFLPSKFHKSHELYIRFSRGYEKGV